MKDFCQEKNPAIILSLFIALAVHAAVFFFLNGYKIETAFFYKEEERKAEDARLVQRDSNEAKEEAERRNEQLAAVFQQMLHAKEEIEAKSEQSLQPEFQDTEQIIALEEANEIKEDAILLPDDWEKIPVETPLRPDEQAAVKEIAYELAQAADEAQGAVPADRPEKINRESLTNDEQAGLAEFAADWHLAELVELNEEARHNLKERVAEQLLAIKQGSSLKTGAVDFFGFLSAANEGGKPQPLPAAHAIIQPGAGSIASSSDFILSVDYAPKQYGQGYLFCLTLQPKPDVHFKRIKQNFHFLIDRSNSIRHQRFEHAKAAVAIALDYLEPEDTFNILFFDSDATRLFQDNMKATPARIAAARRFLLSQKHGGLLASTDIYASLQKIVPFEVPEKEVNTAILLSDGDTFLTSEKQRAILSLWSKRNAGKVSLYSLAAGKGNNLALLDLLSTFNKGSLAYSPSDEGQKATLAGLMESIRNPIGKQIAAHAIHSEPSLQVALLPSKNCLPNLYSRTPYVVYGSANRLADFTLYLQGRYYDKWLDIKLKVRFPGTPNGDAAVLQKKWAIQQAYVLYSKYLKDGQAKHLQKAKELLAPYKIPLAFKYYENNRRRT